MWPVSAEDQPPRPVAMIRLCIRLTSGAGDVGLGDAALPQQPVVSQQSIRPEIRPALAGPRERSSHQG